MLVTLNTDVQVRFRTYFNYVVNFSDFILEEYGADPTDRYRNVFEATVPLLKAITPGSASHDVRRYLKGSFHHRICLHREAFSEDFFEAKNAWTPVQGWYAVHNLLCAVGTYVAPGLRLDHDMSCRNAAQLVTQRKLFPYPWSAFVEADFLSKKATYLYEKFRRPPSAVSNLMAPTTSRFEDHLATALSTTLDRRAVRKMGFAQKEHVKKGRTRRNLPGTEKRRIYQRAGPVTMFDFLYRLRVRVNYGDIDTFVEGCTSVDEAQHFAKALYIVTDATSATLEALLAAYAGATLLPSMVKELSIRHAQDEVVAVRAAYHKFPAVSPSKASVARPAI